MLPYAKVSNCSATVRWFLFIKAKETCLKRLLQYCVQAKFWMWYSIYRDFFPGAGDGSNTWLITLKTRYGEREITYQANRTGQINIKLDRIKELTSEGWFPFFEHQGATIKKCKSLPIFGLIFSQIDVKSHKFTQPGGLKDLNVHTLSLWLECLALLRIVNLQIDRSS